jgi:hypothetical protein
MMNLLPFPIFQEPLRLIDIMHKEAFSVVDKRKAALDGGTEADSENIGLGKDILSVLRASLFYLGKTFDVDKPSPYAVKANMSASDEDRLPESEVISQVKLALHCSGVLFDNCS